MVAWLLKCNNCQDFFYELKIFFLYVTGTHISCVQNRLFISSGCPFHTLGSGLSLFSSIHHYIYFFMATKVNRSTKSDFFYKFQKIIIKKLITPPKNYPVRSLLLDHFYLLISLEGMSTFIQSWSSFQNQIWDVHLYNM